MNAAALSLGLVTLFVVGACGQGEDPTGNERMQGSYGASSGPNANDPDAGVAGADQTPAYDEPELGTGSEEGEQPRTRPDGAVDPIRVPEGT